MNKKLSCLCSHACKLCNSIVHPKPVYSEVKKWQTLPPQCTKSQNLLSYSEFRRVLYEIKLLESIERQTKTTRGN